MFCFFVSYIYYVRVCVVTAVVYYQILYELCHSNTLFLYIHSSGESTSVILTSRKKKAKNITPTTLMSLNKAFPSFVYSYIKPYTILTTTNSIE